MKKYLVPTDGSENSEMAIKTAVNMVKKSGGSITLLSVLDSDAFMTGSQVNVSIAEVMEKNKNALDELTNNYIDKYKDPSFEFNAIIKTGNVANEIILESENGYDMIVIGSRGLSMLKRTFLGSVSNKVVNSVHTPVLVVKEYHENDFSNILVPIDGSNNSKRAMYIAAEIGRLFGSQITLMNIVTELQVPQVRGVEFGVVSDYYPTLSQNSKYLLSESAKKIEDYPYQIKLETKTGNVANVIIEVADEENYDMIALGSRGLGKISRAFMGSVSNAVLHNTKKSVLIIR
ncbi:universal stress protein [Microaceticoccus formicicus]|uniref:universal stress protein n=1 Tax=Microaceticoccus formicicus TaxID=3118105 RepID=UPI003CD01527|nr:universal stress protein [Peptoniphilaceae bacterium AMB_02]